MAKNKKKITFGKILLDLIIILLMVVLAYSGFHLFQIWQKYHKGHVYKEEQQELLYTQVETKDGEEIKPGDFEKLQEYEVDPLQLLKSLREVNPDVIGWIHIPDTTIDYPILQTDNNDYYLDRSLYKDYLIAGSIFMDYKNILGSQMQNYILYGHRMNDDSMFGHLTKFLNKDFFDEHPKFTVMLLDGYYECEVFSVYRTTTYGFEYNICGPFPDEEEYMKFVDNCKAQSVYPTDVEITPKDNIITLSTCDYHFDVNEGRLALQARMVRKISKEEWQKQAEDIMKEVTEKRIAREKELAEEIAKSLDEEAIETDE